MEVNALQLTGLKGSAVDVLVLYTTAYLLMSCGHAMTYTLSSGYNVVASRCSFVCV